jgi:hypothetical protein
MVMDTTAPGPYFSVALTDELSSTFLGRGNRDASCGNAPRMCGILKERALSARFSICDYRRDKG